MITAAQATAYLDQALGISLPGFLVQAAVDKVAPAEAAMVAAGYSSSDQLLVQMYAVALICAGPGLQRIASQGAPSGASRSFKHSENALRDIRRTLAAIDTAGTVTDLVGPDPTTSTLFMVV